MLPMLLIYFISLYDMLILNRWNQQLLFPWPINAKKFFWYFQYSSFHYITLLFLYFIIFKLKLCLNMPSFTC